MSLLMSPSKILKSIKRKLGLHMITIPLSDEELMDIIIEESIPTFSIYFPNYFITSVNTTTDLVPNTMNTYFLDTDVLGDEISILGVSSLNLTKSNNRDNMFLYRGLGVEGLGGLQMDSDLTSMFDTGVQFEFLPPNKVTINGSAQNTYGDISMELYITHAPNLSTISPTKREDFIKLCLLDIKATLYEILKHYSSIETTFGTIDLKIDDWSGANSDREALIDKWKEVYLNDRKKNIYAI